MQTMTNGAGHLSLMDRDYEVLAALEKWGVLGMGQLDGLFFRKGIPPEERTRLLFNEVRRSDYWLGAYKRLGRLQDEGYIRLGSCCWVPRLLQNLSANQTNQSMRKGNVPSRDSNYVELSSA